VVQGRGKKEGPGKERADQRAKKDRCPSGTEGGLWKKRRGPLGGETN